MPRMLSISLALLGAVTAGEAGAEPAPPKPSAPPTLVLALALDRAAYDLGDEAAAEVRLENTADAPVAVHELQLEERSLAIEIRTEGKPDLLYTVCRPNVFFREHAGPLRVTLCAKRSLVAVVPVPLVRAGKTSLAAVYRGMGDGGSGLRSSPVLAEVRSGSATALVARIETAVEGKGPAPGKGVVDVQLDAEAAPLHVMNFLLLARQGFYDRQPFYRVVPDFTVQAGCPQGSGIGDPGWSIANEHKTDQRHVKGSVSMNHPQGRPDAAGSQFFILVKDAPWLDLPEEKYTVFGRVIDGMETVEAVSRVETDGRNGRPVKPVTIVRVVVSSK